MIYKIIRKLNMGPAALKLSRHFVKDSRDMLSLADAREKLMAHSPDPGNSCLRSGGINSRGSFQLDIIIPAYNVEKYIGRCLDSALRQKTDYSYRLIVIDDGSKDKTAEIADSYAHDPRMLIVHQPNRGFSGARNTGLRLSDAEYIMFLDSDDALPENAVELLMDAAVKNGAAIAEGGYITVDPEGRELSRVPHRSGRLPVRGALQGFPWGKVFRAELFEGLCMPEGYWYEDSLMSQIIYPLAESRGYEAVGLAEAVYLHTINPAGITQTGRAKPKSCDSLWITLALHRDREKLGLEKDQKYFEYILHMIALSFRRTEKQPEDVQMAIFVMWRDFLQKEFPDFGSKNEGARILKRAVLLNNFKLYSMACRLL